MSPILYGFFKKSQRGIAEKYHRAVIFQTHEHVRAMVLFLILPSSLRTEWRSLDMCVIRTAAETNQLLISKSAAKLF